MAPVIEISDYSFRIGRKEILKDISLEVNRGEYLSIIGPNGAGKTTLLKCLDRILTGGEGRIEVNGRPLETYSQRELAKLMAYVSQADERTFPYSVYEFVMMGRYPYLSPFSSVSSEDKEAVRQVLAATGTGEFADRRINTLSGGERQKVFIAAALAQGAKILLLDEPTTFLDYKHQADIQAILARLNRESGATIISVTHDINNAVAMSHRVLALKNGRVEFSGAADRLIDNEVLESIYGLSFSFVEHPKSGGTVIIP